MSLPSVVTLIAETVTAAVSGQQFTAVTGLSGVSVMTLEATFAGTGGSTAYVVIRTRLSSADTWRDVARFDFAATGAKWATLTNANASVASFSALSADSVLNGFLGSEYQAVLTTTGTWSSALIAVKAHVS